MAKGIIISDQFTEAQGEVEVALGKDTSRQWHEITVSIFTDTGVPATGAITGTLSAKVRKRGADRTENFASALDLANDQRAWDPELSTAEAFLFTVTGLNANYTYQVTVLSFLP